MIPILTLFLPRNISVSVSVSVGVGGWIKGARGDIF